MYSRYTIEHQTHCRSLPYTHSHVMQCPMHKCNAMTLHVSHATCTMNVECNNSKSHFMLSVTPRIPVRPDWRIRTGFRDARLMTGTLFFFFLKSNWCLWVWPTSYNIIKMLYTNKKDYHRSGVHQNLDKYN